MAEGHAWQGGVHGRGFAWQGVCVVGGMHDRGCAWQGCVHGGGVGSTHPTGMHSC